MVVVLSTASHMPLHTCSVSPLGSRSQISGLIVPPGGPLQATHLHGERSEVPREQCNYFAWGKLIVHPCLKGVFGTHVKMFFSEVPCPLNSLFHSLGRME